MSLADWEKKFYKVPANSDSIKTEMDAVEHSLLKWEGLQPEILEASGVLKVDAMLRDETDLFPIDSSTCALCHYHDDNCKMCVLTKVRGVSCYDTVDSQEELNSPYSAFLNEGNPFPMIDLLKKAKTWLENENK